MNEEILNEIKTQLWGHLQYLMGKIEEMRKEGYVIRTEQIIDQLGVRRRGHFLLDQYLFCKGEIEFWRDLTS